MDLLQVITQYGCIEKIYQKDGIFIGKISNHKLFLTVIKNSENSDSFKVSWYYNSTGDPDIADEIPFIDVLEMVPEELSEYILFNMNNFKNRRS